MLLGRVFDYVRHLPARLHMAWSLVNDPVLSRTYYPEADRKSKLRMLLENVAWVLKKAEANRWYFAYGLDRKQSPPAGDFLGRKEFWKYQKLARASQSLEGQRVDYRCILNDKLVFGGLLRGLGFATPKTLAVCDGEAVQWFDRNQRISLESLLDRDIEVFCKDRLGQCGIGAFQLAVRDKALYLGNKRGTIDELRARTKGRHVLIQERIAQHPDLAVLHTNSVNTIRLVTVVVDGEPRPLFSLLRIGNQGSVCDNCSSGGIMVGIDPEAGVLMRYGYTVPPYGTRLEYHPYSQVRFEGRRIPFYSDAVSTAVALHRSFSPMHSIGWDIAIAEQGPCFVEGNDEWALVLSQILYGGLRDKYMATFPPKR